MKIKVERKSWNLVSLYFFCPKSDQAWQDYFDAFLDFLSPAYLVSLLHSSYCCWSYSLKPKSDLTIFFFSIKLYMLKISRKIKLTYFPIVYSGKKKRKSKLHSMPCEACTIWIEPTFPISSPTFHEAYTSAIPKHFYPNISLFFYRSVSLAQPILSTLNALPYIL